MTATVFKRNTCRLCASDKVVQVVDLEPIPLSENYTMDRESGLDAPRYPVDLYMCEACGHVQHLDVIDSESLWNNYTYFSAMANGMPEHFLEVCNQVLSTYAPFDKRLVIDIGSNDGSLLRPFKNKGMDVLGVDPAKEVARKACEEGIPTIPELMSMELAQKIIAEHGKAAVITAFNVFAHADNLGDMVEAVRMMLAEDGVFVFEAQYLKDIIDGKLIATIFHEHMSHHSVTPLVPFLDKHGLELISIRRSPIQHGSIIGTVQLKGGTYKVDNTVNELLALEKEAALGEVETLKEFNRVLKDQKVKLSAFISKVIEEKQTIAGFGAARSGPTLISQMGLTNKIDFIVDDHPQKVGKYTSGDGIFIYPTEQLCQKMPEYTVILAWVHSKKIIEKNSEYLSKGGKFIVLCPEMRIVSKDEDILL
ncbi:methyltransferase domain-containing protein [Terasakiella pusilla]|uniref:methyltransferase domain-containing protein n=1 Tax=Terasakiella pusilla TaxID=64973 RepID=UPI003AA93B35